MAPRNIIAALDIGTTKVCCSVGESLPDSGIQLLGLAECPCEGLDRGSMVNLEATVDAIACAAEAAGKMADLAVRDVWIGIGGEHVKGVNSRGAIGISRREKEVAKEDVDRVLEAARAVKIPADREILHVIPRGFTVDDQTGIRDPVGMSCIRLEAEVHIISAASTPLRNLGRAIERAGLNVAAMVYQTLASSFAVLEEDEKRLGAAMIDLGGGTTDLLVFQEGVVRHTSVLGLGGRHVTQDIAIGLRTPGEKAEDLKLAHGCALSAAVPPAEVIEVPGVGGRAPREVSRQVLAAIIEPRVEETLGLVLQELDHQGITDLLAAGAVLTGGSALLPGTVELAERVLGIPARVGIPREMEGLPDDEGGPEHAVALGLLWYAAWVQRGKGGRGGGLRGFLRRPIRDWVRNYL